MPVAIIEPNALPGLANRVLSRFAKVAFLAFPAAEAGLHGRCGVRVTGCPVRDEGLRRRMRMRMRMMIMGMMRMRG